MSPTLALGSSKTPKVAPVRSSLFCCEDTRQPGSPHPGPLPAGEGAGSLAERNEWGGKSAFLERHVCSSPTSGLTRSGEGSALASCNNPHSRAHFHRRRVVPRKNKLAEIVAACSVNDGLSRSERRESGAPAWPALFTGVHTGETFLKSDHFLSFFITPRCAFPGSGCVAEAVWR